MRRYISEGREDACEGEVGCVMSTGLRWLQTHGGGIKKVKRQA